MQEQELLGASKEHLDKRSDLKDVKIVVTSSSTGPVKTTLNEEFKNQINLDRNEVSAEGPHPEIVTSKITEDSGFDNIDNDKGHDVLNESSNQQEDPDISISGETANKLNDTNIEMHNSGDHDENKQFIAREVSTKQDKEDKILYQEILNTRKTIQLEINRE